jgi:hypothetical protein
MSRDQKPGRAKIFDGSAKPGRAAPPAAPSASPSPPSVPAAAAAARAPVRVGLFAILFIAASAIAGTGVAVLARLSS